MNDKYLMTGHKLHWHLDRVCEWLDGKQIAPIHIELGISPKCNLDCYFCYGNYSGRDDVSPFLNTERIKKLIKDANDVGVKSITFAGEGENTLHPDFYNIVNYGNDIGMDMALLSNGTAIKEEGIEDLLKGMTYIRFSISASTRESFKQIQGRDLFDNVIENISKCVKKRNELGLNTVIGTMMVLTDKNIEDVIPLAKISRDLGVNYFVIKPCSDDPHREINVNTKKYLEEEVNNILKQAERLSTDNFNVIVKYGKLSNLGINTFKKCYGTNFSISISSHGNVAPCGNLHLYRKDDFRMGNILEEDFKDIVKSKRYKEVQDKVQTLNVNKECETNCLQHEMNKYLDMLKTPPEHINFP